MTVNQMSGITGLFESLNRRLRAARKPKSVKRTDITAEVVTSTADDEHVWVHIYRVWLVGTGDETTCYKKKRIDTRVVSKDDIGDDTLRFEVMRDSSSPSNEVPA